MSSEGWLGFLNDVATKGEETNLKRLNVVRHPQGIWKIEGVWANWKRIWFLDTRDMDGMSWAVDMEWKHGDVETWKLGNAETRKRGNAETWKRGNAETWKRSNVETRQSGNAETWK